MNEQNKIKDVYNGEYITIWEDGDFHFLTFIFSGVSISIPNEIINEVIEEISLSGKITTGG